MRLALGEYEDPLWGVPLNLTSRDLTQASIFTSFPSLPPLKDGPPAPSGRQFCLIGRDSVDPLIPGVCNVTVMVGAALLLGGVMLMRSGR